jgi:hypothetical protein
LAGLLAVETVPAGALWDAHGIATADVTVTRSPIAAPWHF